MCAYKYVPASLSIYPQGGTNPKQQYIDLFQQTLKEQFYNSSNWWTIQEETEIGSQVYQNVDARITNVINAETGLKLGDDWKTLLFSDCDYDTYVGRLYIFDDNTWLTVNTEKIKSLTATCTIRRCNNTLRWIDEETGAYYEEPCSFEPEVKEPRNYATQGSPFITPGGFLKIYAQLNERTKQINENQKFLFGNTGHWTAYRVIGTGINDLKNTKTYDNDSAKVLTLDLVADYTSPDLDDLVNGISYTNKNVYTLSLNTSSVEGYSGSTIQLTGYITYNGNSVDRPLTWTSSNTRIATVSGSGLISLIATGSCVVTACITNNPVSASCTVTVTGSPTMNSELVIAPASNYVLEGATNTYSVYLYENGVQQADAITVACNPNSVPSTSYVFTQTDANHFTVNNVLRDTLSYLTISCTTSGSITKSTNIYLRGAWNYDII